jgi:hypothetical protein
MRATGGETGPSPDLSLVRAALAVLADPSAGLEIRPLKKLPDGRTVPRSHVIRGDDLDGAARPAGANAEGFQVYFTLNPIPLDVPRARDSVVLSRRWLLIDIDPVRADGFADDSATEAEKDACRQTTEAVWAWLTEQGWPAPVMVDSGNGFYLLYRLDLPNTPLSRELCKGVLKVLHDRQWPGRAEIDLRVFNASRIAKLPGTWALRGRKLDDRPYRLCRVLYCPEAVEIVPPELITAVVGTGAPEAPAGPPPRPNPFRMRASGDPRRWARKALENECARVRLATPGGKGGTGRNSTLWNAACNIGEIVAGGGLLRQEAEQALADAGRFVESPEGEIADVIRRGLDQGGEKPRCPPERNGAAEPPPDEPPAGDPIIQWASDVVPRPVAWLWPSYLPEGKLTTFAGQTGQGKTFAVCDIMTRVTRGLAWPDGGGAAAPGRCLFISGDDELDDTIVPRLMSCGADLSRVAFFTEKTQENWTLAA